ncbi:unnamed protein product [Moneuplotes crassus]|uniref:Uncharacterized protein n=1 Tax=Euplotes crassus TaxID=5936 RepID=A0AAD1Y5L5_EUPCR|nr:unnamed protein product [Moneuplotes crassus]
MEEPERNTSRNSKRGNLASSSSFLHVPMINIGSLSVCSEGKENQKQPSHSHRENASTEKLEYTKEGTKSDYFPQFGKQINAGQLVSTTFKRIRKAKDDSVLSMKGKWNNLKETWFETINKRFHIKEKVKQKELPRVFPLESFRIGRTGSYLQLDGQLFVIINSDKFIYFVVNSERKPEKENKDFKHLAKNVLKKFLSLSSYFILESANKELGPWGTIAFEVRYDELYGMEFTNSLLQDSCRIVTECRSLRKKSFNNVVDMLKYYEIEATFDTELQKDDQKVYHPILKKDKHNNTIVYLKRLFPKCESEEFQKFQGCEKDTQQNMVQRTFVTEPDSLIDSTESCIDTKFENQILLLNTPDPKSRKKDLIENNEKLDIEVDSLKSVISEDFSNCKLTKEPMLCLSDSKNPQTEVPKEEPPIENLCLSERIIPNVTVQGYFDDPLLPYRMREVIVMKKNKKLLRHYETSLPSWTVVMATYGYYRPSFRKFQYWFMMFISLVSMMIGFFDLYKNLPIVKPFLKFYMESIWDFLEDHVILRMSVFLGYLFTNTSIFSSIAINFMQLPLLGAIWNSMEYLVIGLQMMTLPFTIFKGFFALIFTLLKFIVIFPYAPIMSLIYTIKLCFLFFWGILKTFKGFISSFKQLIYATSEIRNSKDFLQMVTEIFFLITRSSAKKLFDGCKAIYNTIAYIGAEIGKYRYSILRYLYEKFVEFLFSIDKVFTKPGRQWLATKLAPERLWNSQRKRNMLNTFWNVVVLFLMYHFITGYLHVVCSLEGFEDN